MAETTLTADGSFTQLNFPAPTAAVRLSGGFGGGTATISIKQGATGTNLTLDTATAAYDNECVVGVGNTIDVTLAGATGATLLVQIIPVRT